VRRVRRSRPTTHGTAQLIAASRLTTPPVRRRWKP
jgi:hypothetical protein